MLCIHVITGILAVMSGVYFLLKMVSLHNEMQTPKTNKESENNISFLLQNKQSMSSPCKHMLYALR